MVHFCLKTGGKRLKPDAVPLVFLAACKGKQSSAREEKYNKRVKSDRDCFEIVC